MSNLKMKITDEEYKVDTTNKVVIFSGKFVFLFSGEIIFTGDFRGKARCSNEDVFDVRFGKSLARNKAVIKARSKFERMMRARLKEYKHSVALIEEILKNNATELSKDNEKLSEKLLDFSLDKFN